MVKRLTLLGLLAAAGTALWLSTGCGPTTDLIGTPVPNTPPGTRVTATPPSLIETGFIVHFHWSGYDPDGRIEKYQWRISDNGTNGISVRDTLTIDPVTGDTLNPWFETTATDTVFLVTADIPHFPGDPEGTHYPRSFQSHTFWVRAVDDKGAVDPSPAHVSFTSTTLLPTVQITGPGTVAQQTTDYVNLPAAATFTYRGNDPDFHTGMPTKIRFLWKVAELNGVPINSSGPFNDPAVDIDDLIDFEDSNWTPWRRYESDIEKRRILIEGLTPDINTYYFFAVQVQDTAGAVSIGRGYGRQVGNVRIAGNMSPVLTVTERYLGFWPNRTGVYNFLASDIAAGQELEFSWEATANAYLGTIESYQYGWNVSDPYDPDDPGWALQPGLSPQHMETPLGTSFSSGAHTLTIKVIDNSNQITLFRMTLNVVRVPNRDDQDPVLMIDDVPDRGSNAWSSQQGQRLDRDQYRDAFWLNALYGPGGVALFNPANDIVDIRVAADGGLDYRRAVQYKTLVWNTRLSAVDTYVGDTFRPTFFDGGETPGDRDKFIWLIPYQETVGNVLYAGAASVLNHLARFAAGFYEVPVVFESREGNAETGIETIGNRRYRRGFGRREVHGETVWLGPTRYPFMVLGVSVLDLMSSDVFYEYGTSQLLGSRRKPGCVAAKGLAIDPQFKAQYMPVGAGFPDTIYADPLIDWNDQSYLPGPGESDILSRLLPSMWGNTEFYNDVIVARGTPYTIQEGAGWGCDGPCVLPMFRSIARFDWIRHQRVEADPQDDWPYGYYDETGGPAHRSLEFLCGPNALTGDYRSVRTNDRVVGFLAEKFAAGKPYPKPDVIWGFDPYRFNNEHMTRVIQWVLGEHFDLDMTAGDDTNRP